MVSRLAELDREDLIIALLALVGTTTEGSLRAIAEETFDGFIHRGDALWRTRLREDIRRSLGALESDGFIVRTQDGEIDATDMGRICGREGLSVTSARAVLNAAESLIESGESLDEMALVGLAQITAELDRLYTPVEGNDHEHWPGLVARKFLVNRDALYTVLNSDAAQALKRLKRFYAVVRWLQGEQIVVIEKEFTAFYPDWKREEPMAGMIRQISSRTGHVLRPVGALLAIRFPELKDLLRQRVVDLQPRLEFGIAREGAGLARYRLGLTRGEIRKLQELQVSELEALYDALKAQHPDVMGILGSSKAASLVQTIERQRPTMERKRRTDEAAQLAIFDQVPAAATL